MPRWRAIKKWASAGSYLWQNWAMATRRWKRRSQDHPKLKLGFIVGFIIQYIHCYSLLICFVVLWYILDQTERFVHQGGILADEMGLGKTAQVGKKVASLLTTSRRGSGLGLLGSLAEDQQECGFTVLGGGTHSCAGKLGERSLEGQDQSRNFSICVNTSYQRSLWETAGQKRTAESLNPIQNCLPRILSLEPCLPEKAVAEECATWCPHFQVFRRLRLTYCKWWLTKFSWGRKASTHGASKLRSRYHSSKAAERWELGERSWAASHNGCFFPHRVMGYNSW